MKRQLFSLVTIVTIIGIIVGIIGPSAVSATVPGVNSVISSAVGGGAVSSGSPANSSTSQDGRYVAFRSNSTDLVSPSTNGQNQVFVRDRLNGATTLISASSSGVQGNSGSYDPKISEDGRYVVFDSQATNLVSGDTNHADDIFIHDLQAGTTSIVSTSSSGALGNSSSGWPSVTADGNYVVFFSYATNLVSSPSVSGTNVYEKNMLTGEVKLISQSSAGIDGNANSGDPVISCEGRFIAFVSYANNLISGDSYDSTHNIDRIYIIDMLKPLNPVDIKADADGTASYLSISCNGNYVTFLSNATNMVSGDTNGYSDTFTYDRINGIFDRDSVASDGTQSNNESEDYDGISNDGKYVVFSSVASNLVSGGTNGYRDVFLHNRQTGATELITRDSSGTFSDGSSYSASISSDGRYVSYGSNSDNLVSGYSHGGGTIYASQTGATDDY